MTRWRRPRAGRWALAVLTALALVGTAGEVAAEPVAGGSKAAAAPATAVAPGPALSPAQKKALARAVAAGDRKLAKKRWPAAEAAYRKALAISDGSLRARYGLAAALARQGKGQAATAELTAIATSKSDDAPRWLVEARLSDHFAALRVDDPFRKVVGIDPDPNRPLTAYERLVGTGGNWEQTGAPCEAPTVALDLDRKKAAFKLDIRFRCQGGSELTALRGTWKASGADTVTLVFPNPGGPDERLSCKLSEKAGEDTLGCMLDDIELALKVVRR